MHTPGGEPDVLETVTSRRPLLEALADGAERKRTLVDRLECSRSTVDRAVRETERLRLVERGDGGYRLTLAGRLALEQHRRSLEALASVGDAAEVLRHVPRDAPMSVAMLEGATTVEPRPHAPVEPLQRLGELLEEATRVRSLNAAERVPGLRTRLVGRADEGTLDASLVFTEELASFLRTEYPEQFRTVVIDGGFDIAAVESLPYELTVVETPTTSTAMLFVLNETMGIRGVVRNDSRAALEWADDVHRQFESAATPVSPPE